MSGVTLSAGIQSTLLSLQGTAAQTSAIQTRLSTGKKVNSAIENPRSFFTALSLNARAGNLNALLDSIGQAQQTLKAASQGLGSLVKLTQAARSLAQQARQSLPPQVSYAAIEVAGSASVSGEVAGSVTGNVDTSGGFLADVNGLQIQVGATVYTVSNPGSPGTESISTIISRINGTSGLGASGAVKAALDATGKFITLTANSTDTSFQVLASGAATALGIAGQTGNSTNLLLALPALAGTSLTVQANGGSVHTVNFGSGASQVSTFKELQSALSGAGVSATLAGGGVTLSVAGTIGTRNALNTSGTALAALGLAASTNVYGAVTSTTPDAGRTTYQAQYNLLLQQIDAMATDSGYGGSNLLRGNDVRTALNEAGTSSLTVSGVTLGADGLGLLAASGEDFQSNDIIGDLLARLDTALMTLRTQASTFGSNLTVLQTRQDFTRTLIGTLQSGAADLVLADMNQEGANLLALQTRQALSITALSITSQGEQAALRLFQ